MYYLSCQYWQLCSGKGKLRVKISGPRFNAKRQALLIHLTAGVLLVDREHRHKVKPMVPRILLDLNIKSFLFFCFSEKSVENLWFIWVLLGNWRAWNICEALYSLPPWFLVKVLPEEIQKNFLLEIGWFNIRFSVGASFNIAENCMNLFGGFFNTCCL